MQARIVLLTAFCAVLTGCSGGTETPQAQPSTTAPALDAAPGLHAASEQAAGIPPEPSAPVAAAYIADLKAIDPAIVGDKDPGAIVDRGRDQCASIHDWPRDEDKVFELAQARFTAPGHPDGFDADTTRRILQTVRKHLCPGY